MSTLVGMALGFAFPSVPPKIKYASESFPGGLSDTVILSTTGAAI